MISVVVYGRNDSHWSNIHKRAAISINTLAHVLKNPNDEIIFVDYNTPNDLETFPEAIADTLTEDARKKLRVFRVRPQIHQSFSSWTPLNVVESIARNIGIRRMQRTNEWCLLTNTDCIVFPLNPSASLSDIVQDLQGTFYCNPRYEIPETLWGSVSRNDPEEILVNFRKWSHELHLRTKSYGHSETIYDYPGDFQLVRTEQLFEISGLNEHLLLIGKCDVDLARRLAKNGHSCDELTDVIDVFHCSHTRGATPSSANRRLVNFQTYFLEKYAHLQPPQPHDWGHTDVEIEEVNLSKIKINNLVSFLSGTLVDEPKAASPLKISNNIEEEIYLCSGDVVYYILDLLYNAQKDWKICYIGYNEHLHSMIGNVVHSIGFKNPLRALNLNSEKECIEKEIDQYQLVIVDFSLDDNFPIAGFNNKMLSKVMAVAEHARARELDRLGNAKSHLRTYIFVNLERSSFYSTVKSLFNLVVTPLMTRVSYGHVRGEAKKPVDRFTLAKALGRPSMSVAEFEVVRERLRVLACLDDLDNPEARALMAPPLTQLAQLMVDGGDVLPNGRSLHPFLTLLKSRFPQREAGSAVLTYDSSCPAFSKLASIKDWDDDQWSVWAQLLIRAEDPESYTARRDYDWDRIQVLYVLSRLGLLSKSSRIFLQSDRTDPLLDILSDRVVLATEGLLQPAPRFQGIIVMRNLAQRNGKQEILSYLKDLSRFLVEGGVLVLSLDIAITQDRSSETLTLAEWNEGDWLDKVSSYYKLVEPVLPGIDPITWECYLPACQPHLQNPIFVRERNGISIARAVLTLQKISTGSTA